MDQRKVAGIIQQRNTRREPGEAGASGDGPVNILASLTVLMLIPAAPAPGDDLTPTIETTHKKARSDRRAKWVPSKPGPWHRTLRAARSTDGLKFLPDEGVAIRFANAPAMTKLPDGRLLLVYEYFSRTKRRDFGRLGFSYSKDDGKTWTSPKPLEIRRLSRRVGRPCGPAFIKTAEGSPELYFVCDDRKGRQTIFVAKVAKDDPTDEKATKGEIAFEIRDKVRLEDREIKIDDLALANIAGKLHLYAAPRGKAAGIYHGTFSTPTRIDGKGLIGAADLGKPGMILKTAEAWRLYATAAEKMHRLETGATVDVTGATVDIAGAAVGIISATSPDGINWSRDEGLRLKEAADPAVVRLADDTYLMLYVERRRPTYQDDQLSTESLEQPADEQGPDFESWYAAIDEQSLAEDEDAPFSESGATDLLDAALEGADAIDLEDAQALVQEDAALQDLDAEYADELANETDDFTAEDDYEQTYCQGDVPIPDFRHHVDYRAWMEQRHDAEGITENAYDYYEAFMPMPGDEPGDKPEWPQFYSMFHDTGRTGPPGPWDPADHPEWEATFLASAELEEMYAQAAAIEDYLSPMLMAEPSPPDEAHDQDRENLMLNFLLPTLSSHRAMTKQTLGDAWRAPDGRVDPQRMLDAFETTLGSAEHLAHGDFLIETLVSVAQKKLVEDSARWALQHNVFSADEMESALEILIAKDRHLPDPGQMLEGELAASLDYSQYVFGPIDPNREPTLNPARAAYISDMAIGPPPTEEQIASADPYQTVEAFINHYETLGDMMRRGYPEVRPEDIQQLEQAAVQDNYAVRAMLPSLSRVYQLVNRQEASRRATQLTYAIHLHKARTGQWPTSLDDLPLRYTQDVRTDPFSGEDFVYRLTDNGPLLYSTSENGLDDGGSHHRRWGDKNNDDEESDDHVFWPPQQR